MDYTRIADTDLSTSRIGLGTWAIGGRLWGGTDRSQAVRAIHAALDRGINLIDTAPAYGDGRAERIVGRALAERGRRDDVIISTKAGLRPHDDGVVRDARPERIVREIRESLERLGTDHIDIYHVHWPDPRIPIEDTAEAMHRLYRKGLIRAIGVSNYLPEQMELFRQAAPLHVCQPPHNLFERGAEAETLPYCRDRGITSLTYGVLCRGLLSGRMRADTRFATDDLRRIDPKFRAPRFPEYLRTVELLDRFARERFDRRVVQLAARWALDTPGVDVVLWGMRRAAHVEAVDGVLGWSLSVADRRDIERILVATAPRPIGPDFMAPPARDPAAERERAERRAQQPAD